MRRYTLLLRQQAEKVGTRPLARELGLPAQSISNYLLDGTEPRISSIERMAAYFGEPISALLREVDAEVSTEDKIISEMGKMTAAQKKALLKHIRETVKQKP